MVIKKMLSRSSSPDPCYLLDGDASGDQVLDGLEGLIAVLDQVDLEAVGLKTGLGSSNALLRGGLGVGGVGKRGQLGVRLGQGGEGVGDVGVLGVGSHCN